MTGSEEIPVAIIGAGPIGLAAAAHLIQRGMKPQVFEAGSSVASSIRDWSHVSLFTPWRSLIDKTARSMLEDAGWSEPDPEGLPTGGEFIDSYLAPLAALPAIADSMCLESEVVGVSRYLCDKIKTRDREKLPFVLRIRRPDGSEWEALASNVIDASGTWRTPNPLGSDGMEAIGEAEHADCIHYGIPDPLGHHRDLYAGKRTVIVGAGYSAANVVLDLLNLKRDVPDTSVVWAIRGHDVAALVTDHGEGPPSRIALGRAVLQALEANTLELVTRFRVRRISSQGGSLTVTGSSCGSECELPDVDHVVCTTGQRPNTTIFRELRVSVDPALECVSALKPLIDPNEHSCYSVPSHGWRELEHALEPGFYIVGMKSYGRAPTFLAITGYQQVTSVVAAISGDLKGADELELDARSAMADASRVEAAIASSG